MSVGGITVLYIINIENVWKTEKHMNVMKNLIKWCFDENVQWFCIYQRFK